MPRAEVRESEAVGNPELFGAIVREGQKGGQRAWSSCRGPATLPSKSHAQRIRWAVSVVWTDMSLPATRESAVANCFKLNPAAVLTDSSSLMRCRLLPCAAGCGGE
jgi:hypothetical protein